MATQSVTPMPQSKACPRNAPEQLPKQEAGGLYKERGKVIHVVHQSSQHLFTWYGTRVFPTSPEAIMHLSAWESCHMVFLFCILLRNCQAFKNDATEILYSHVSTPLQDAPSNVSLNRARNGGRGAGNTAHERAGEYFSM